MSVVPKIVRTEMQEIYYVRMLVGMLRSIYGDSPTVILQITNQSRFLKLDNPQLLT